MKKTYITPISRYCVISESAMMCTSGKGLQLDDDNATNDRTGGDDGTDSYIKKHSLWDLEW